MKLFYTVLFNLFFVLNGFAQHSLEFKFSESANRFKNSSYKKSPIQERFTSLSLGNFNYADFDLQLKEFDQYSSFKNKFKSSVLRDLLFVGVNSNNNKVAFINGAPPVIECTFIATVNALSSTDICPGSPVVLSTQNGPGYTFQWLFNDEIIPNAIASTYAAFQAGEYSVIIHTRSCKGESVPMTVTVKGGTYFNPLQDTVKQCGGVVLLNGGEGFSDYIWDSGQLTQSITVNTTNSYLISVMSANGCLLKDSCFVSLIDVQIHQNDSIVCSGSQVELYVSENNGIINNGLSCLWLNGSTSNPLTVYPIQTTNYIVDISNGYGVCRDSINIHVNRSTSSVKQVSACSSYFWNETTYTQTGVYHFTTTNSNGCDSLMSLYLNIQQPVISTTNISACDSYYWYGHTYTTSGLYEHTTPNGSSCGNIDQLNLTVNHPSESIEYKSSCESYIWNNQTYSNSGTYTYTTSNGDGCDSIATLILTINNRSTSVTNITAEYSYMWNGMTYFNSGTYVYMSTNVNGCDSIALLVLDINSNLDCTITASSTNICEGQSVILSTPEINTPSRLFTYRSGTSVNNISNFSYLWSNGEATSIINVTPVVTTTYTVTISDGNTSCTNSITINVNHASASTEEISSCGSYTWNGEVYTQSGSYIFTTTNVAGCDSIATLNLTINQASASTEEITSCGNYTWNGEVYTQSGSYIFTTTNAAGCDSVATLNLLIQSLSIIPDAITPSRNSINAGESVLLNVIGGSLGVGAVWNWYTGYCGGTLVGTGNQISVLPLMNTTYYVRAEGTCNNTECVSVSISVNTCGATGITSNASNNVICNGSSVVLSVQGTPGLGGNWNWYKNGCGVGCVIGTGSSITVNPRVTTTYYVMSVGGQCGTTNCQSITIYVNDAPHRPAAINGPITVTCNSHSVVYSVIPVAGATSYTWTVPTGSTIISGQGTSSIEVDFTRVINHNGHCNSNSICVKANNECGSSCATCISISTDMHGTHFEHEEDRSFGNNSLANLIPEIKTWPMPATSYLFIDAGTIQPVKIEIVDRLGKIVFTSLWKNKVDVSNLASGYYFLRVYSRTGVKTKQVEVIR